MRKPTFLVLAAIFSLAPKLVAAQSFEFPVEHKRTLRNHRGTLLITSEKIEYRTAHQGESRSWQYVDIQQIKIESPTELEIMTYEDQKLMFGRDRVFKFKLLEGKITSEISALLVAKATRPVATSIMLPAEEPPRFEIPVKHLHTLGGCQGRLKIYPDRVSYESADEPRHSRYWRYADIQHFGHPARYQFEITTFEQQFGGPTKIYNFELKDDLPALAYDYLWVRVNPMKLYPYEKTARLDALVAPESRRPEQTAAPTAEAAPEQQAPRPQLQKHTEALSLRNQDEAASKQQASSEIQTAKVILSEQGYQPDGLNLKPGIPARIEFVRQVETTCGTEIVIPEYNIKRKLPLNKPVFVEFTPDKTGEFAFTCGMNMLRGKIIVRESK
jgi:hypothetical protein